MAKTIEEDNEIPDMPDFSGVMFLVIGIIMAVVVGYIVLNTYTVAIEEYCQGLVNNGTITNMSECNVTVDAMADIGELRWKN